MFKTSRYKIRHLPRNNKAMAKLGNTFVLYKTKLDSIRILIEANQIEANTHSINIPVQPVTEDGEVVGEFKKSNAAEVRHRGARYYIGYIPSLKYGMDTIQAYSITITAKMLGKDYGEGITIDNLFQIYKFIQEQKHTLKFSYDTMLRAMWGSAEYAYDFIANDENYRTILKVVDENRREWVTEGMYYNPFKGTAKDRSNLGFELNTRAKATPAKPYIHVYNKWRELENEKNRELVEMHGLAWPDNMRRIERCFKGTADFGYLKVPKPRNLEELLTFDHELIDRETREAIDKYYLMEEKTMGKKTNAIRETVNWPSIMAEIGLKMNFSDKIEEMVTEILKEAGAKPYTVSRAKKAILKAKGESRKKTVNLGELNFEVQELMKKLGIIRPPTPH